MLRALVVSLAMLTVSLGACVAETAPPEVGVRADSNKGEDSAAERELLEAANKSRQLAGVAPLRMDESLHEAARTHAERMVASDRLEHQLPGEPSLMQRIALTSSLDGGLKPDGLKLDRAGENIAYADSGPKVNDALMRSPPHRENLLDRGFNVAGIAAIWSKGRLYVVQDFAHEVPSYSAQQSGKLVGRSVGEMRQQAGLSELTQLTPPKLDEAACSLARENPPNAHLLAAAYDNRKIITYTQSHPEILPQAAVSMLRDPGVHQFAVGCCYARNAAHPSGTYWIAILLY